MIRISRWDRSWPFAQIDSQLIALFFEKLFLDDELADLALQMRGAAFLFLGRFVSCVLGHEDRWHVVFKVLLPSADLGRGDVVLMGDLLDRHFSLQRLGGDTGFQLGGEMSPLSFHRDLISG